MCWGNKGGRGATCCSARPPLPWRPQALAVGVSCLLWAWPEGVMAWHLQLPLSWSWKMAAGSCSQDSPLLADLSEEGTAGR